MSIGAFGKYTTLLLNLESHSLLRLLVPTLLSSPINPNQKFFTINEKSYIITTAKTWFNPLKHLKARVLLGIGNDLFADSWVSFDKASETPESSSGETSNDADKPEPELVIDIFPRRVGSFLQHLLSNPIMAPGLISSDLDSPLKSSNSL